MIGRDQNLLSVALVNMAPDRMGEFRWSGSKWNEDLARKSPISAKHLALNFLIQMSAERRFHSACRCELGLPGRPTGDTPTWERTDRARGLSYTQFSQKEWTIVVGSTNNVSIRDKHAGKRSPRLVPRTFFEHWTVISM